MNMRAKLKFGTLLMAATTVVLLSGCVTRITDFTLLSTKNIDLTKASTFKRSATRVTGEDTISIIIFIPTGVPHVKEAVDKALEGVPGAVALVDGVVKSSGWWFIFGQSSIIVEGTPLIDPTLTSQALPSNRMIAFYDQVAGKYQIRYVDAVAYATVQNSVKDGKSVQIEDVLSANR
jgi:hypothetical protein